jgi:predicted transposase/invertase (TIGR01784 family)
VVVIDNLSNACEESLKRVEKITGKTLKFYKGDIADKELMDKILTENDRIHNSFVFKEKETNEVLTELAEIHFIELEKLRNKKEIDKNNLLNEWLMFIENPESEEIDMIAKKIPEIKEAKKTLEILSLDKKARMTYEQRQKALKDKISMLSGAKEEGIKEGREEGIKEGIKEGIEKEKFNIALNMLENGMSKDVVEKITGLSKTKVEKIEKEIKHK